MEPSLLTSEEIEDVLDVIKPLKFNENACENVKTILRKQLANVKLYKECLPEFKKEIEKQYHKSTLQPGEMVGVIAASSIGEQNTQASLNSFHSSGAFKANLTGGLARMNELMNATENTKTPSLTIYFSNEVKQNLETIRSLAFSKLVYVILDDLVQDIKIEKNPQKEKWYEAFELFNNMNHEMYHGCQFRARLYLNVQKLWRHQISMRHIVKCINNTIELQNQVFFVWSHESIGIFDIWVYDDVPSFASVMNLKEASKIAGNITEENKMQCYINKVLLAHILNVYLTGVKGVEECYYTNEKGTWRIDTKGGSLKDLFRLECVDGKRCRSNDMHEVSSIFGIEAVKQFLRDEFSSLIKVNPRHLELLIDSMTVSGSIQRVTRNGIDRKQVGTIAKASFEQPVDNFLISASTGERDPLKGVSASITVGKMSNIGTGFFDLYHDPVKLEKLALEQQADIELNEVEEESGRACNQSMKISNIENHIFTNNTCV